ncbi:UPF0746 protein DDB_G0281095-like [Ixodes scapularis]|uniref:UPF0746 protein DDB_G0281095-like n=1 Tax=Ixodes scapularis TaxID=6945 RepID=UPI001C38C7A5|nr:UPF0746 protein DDB_G0281095-like [Ixodes scapularis]
MLGCTHLSQRKDCHKQAKEKGLRGTLLQSLLHPNPGGPLCTNFCTHSNIGDSTSVQLRRLLRRLLSFRPRLNLSPNRWPSDQQLPHKAQGWSQRKEQEKQGGVAQESQAAESQPHMPWLVAGSSRKEQQKQQEGVAQMQEEEAAQSKAVVAHPRMQKEQQKKEEAAQSKAKQQQK